MRFYEYEAKALFARHGTPLLRGCVARTAAEAAEIARDLAVPVVLKSQVLTGGRMKAGGVKFADTPAAAEAAARAILALEIRGQKPRGVLVEERAAVANEYFAAVTWDGRRKLPVLVFSDMGGIDIEEVAERHPEHVGQIHVSTLLPFTPYRAKEAIAAVGVSGEDLNRLTPIVATLGEIFLRYDLTLAEINPLGKTRDGRFLGLHGHGDLERDARDQHAALLQEHRLGRDAAHQPPPRRHDRHLPHPGRVGGRRVHDPPQVRRRVLRPHGVHVRGRGTRGRQDEGLMSILIHRDTAVIIQGITGREAVNLTREGLDYGTRIVGGVTPGRAGRDVYGVPVYDCVRDITVRQHVDGSIVTVPPRFTRDAVFEAVEAGVKLVVVVTERIPRGEVAQMVELARLRGARLIRPNCLGILSPEEAKMGGLGGPAVTVRRAFKKGPIGVMSRSGGMTTEICNTLSAAGLGQSTAVSIGGDAIIGSTYAELMPLFEADPETRAIVIYSEPGGRMEAELADWVREHRSRLPIVAFMAGRFMDEMPGMRFGHAGTIVEGKADTTADNIARMQAAGIP